MENKMQIFENAEFGQIRTAGTAEKPTFCLADLCRALELDSSAVARRLEDGVISNHPIIDSLGRTQNANFVNEDGLYDVILDSRKPEAKKFRKWITSEVLPSIRKHGAYFTPKTFDEILKSPSHLMTLLKNWQEDLEEKERLQEVVEIQNLQISEMTPKASYYDLILQSSEAIPISVIAKDYGMSGKAMNQLLHTLKIQYPMSGTWLVYQNYAKRGYTCTKTVSIREDYTKTYTNWTQKGRLFLYEVLKQNGYLPLIEQMERD